MQEGEGVADDGETALGEDVDFDEADGFDGVHVKVGGGPAFGGHEGGGEGVDGVSGEDDAAGVHFGMAWEAVEEGGHGEGAAPGFFVEGEVTALWIGAEGFDEVLGTVPGEVFGEATDLKFGHAEDFGDIGDGGSGLVGGEAADDSGVVGAVALEDELDDVVFAVVGEVDVDIGEFVEGHAFRVQEAAEVEFEPYGADAADTEAVAGEGIGGAAAGDPVDTPGAAILEQLPDVEEIIVVADGGDDAEFFLNLGEELAGLVCGVTSVESLENQMAEKRAGCGGVGWGEGREVGCGEGDAESGAAFGQFAGVIEESRVGLEGLGEGLRGAEVPGAVASFGGVFLVEEREGSDALEDVEAPAVGGCVVTDFGDGECGDVWVGSFEVLTVLDGVVEALGEGVLEGGMGLGAGGEEAIGGAGFRPGWRLERAGVREVLEEFGLGEELAEIGVSGGVGDVEPEGGTVPLEGGADNGLEAGLGGSLGEGDGGVEVRGVGEGESGNLVLDGELDEVGNGQGGVEK